MQVATLIVESWVDQGKKKPAGMKSTLLYTAQSTLSHAPLLRKKKAVLPVDDQVPVASFVDDVKRKMKLKHVMQHTSEALPGRLETKEDVNYRYAENPERSCGKCTHFIFPGACDMVAGLIRIVDVCNEFEAKDSLARNQASPTVQATFVDSVKKESGEGGPGSGPQKGGGVHAQSQMARIAALPPAERRQATHALRRQGLTRHEQSEEGGPGSGRRPGGKTIYAKQEPEGDEDRQIGTFTRREKPAERRQRIKDKPVDPAQAKAIRRAILVVRATLARDGAEAMSTMGSHVAISDMPGSDAQDYTAPGLKHGRRGAA